jgi:menaquinone-dependent protoporphyrinogen oxidase
VKSAEEAFTRVSSAHSAFRARFVVELPLAEVAMSRFLIVYGSAYGQTERIAQRIGQVLMNHDHAVTLHRGDRLPAQLLLREYDVALVAASVHAGRHQRYIEGFVRHHVRELNAMPSAFISVSGSAASSTPEGRAGADQCVTTFLRDTSWQPRATRTFGGALAYTQYNWFVRVLMRWISRRNGGPTDTSRDHDLTDWLAVERFARELAVGEFAARGAPAAAAGSA